MQAERWRRIERLYHSALERESGERGKFLSEACGNDKDLRSEIESLLKQDVSGNGPLDLPAWGSAERLLETTNHPRLDPGTQLGPHRIEGIIGAGGMGEVYRAHDTRLRRAVAIKVLRAEFSKDPERQRRFEREARAAAMMNHPNIVAVYDFGTHEGILYVVTELLDGHTLRESLKGQPLPQSIVVRYARQIANGLRAAHQHGIVHRDLKPENIFITKDGTVKILDLGLAKLIEPEIPDANSETDSLNSQPGILMGTAGYMSPEQVRGEAVDARSDIFAFGTIVYEMASGAAPFRRETLAESMHAILKENPAELSSPALERIVRHCLEKDRTQRFQSAHDLVFTLEALAEAPSDSSGAAPLRRGRTTRLVWLAGCLVVLAVAAIALIIRLRSPAPESEPRVVPFTSYTGFQTQPAFSPDGNEIAFAWTGDHGSTMHIYVQVIGTNVPLQLTSGDKDDGSPAWAPEGQSIAFIRKASDTVNAIYTVSPLGGRERRVAELAAPRNLSEGDIQRGYKSDIPSLNWSRDAKWLVTFGLEAGGNATRILAASADTGEIHALDFGGTFDELWPALSPDSRGLAFCRWLGESGSDIYTVGLTADFRPAGAPHRLDLPRGANIVPAWTADGTQIVFGHWDSAPIASRLWRVPANGSGRAQPLQAVSEGAFYPTIAPRRNRLAFQHRFADVNIWQMPISGSQVSGAPHVLVSSTRAHAVRPHAFSPDGQKIAFESDRSGPRCIWIANADGSSPTLLYGGPGYLSGSPAWSPDGKWIAFDTRKDGHAQIYVISPDGGAPRRITNDSVDDMVPSWSRDGKWIYFDSERGNRFEIFKIPPSGGAAVQVTYEGGWAPQESIDGQFIYYARLRADGSPLLKMPVAGGPEVRILPRVPARGWAITARGVWFLETTTEVDELRFMDFQSKRTTSIARLGIASPRSVAVSPDQRTLLYSRVDSFGTEILLVENFR